MGRDKGIVPNQITQQDIDAMSRQEALEAMGVVSKALNSVKSQIDEAKVRAIGGHYSDPDWFRRANGARRALGWVSQRLAARLSVLKAEEKAGNIKRSSATQPTWERAFVRAAKRMLSESLYAALAVEADAAITGEDEEAQ